MACVALPTCGLALAESERYLPELVTALDGRLAAHGLADDDIVIRMTGCPNGCARPYLAEIGLVGKGPGRYNLYLGAAFDGSRLSKLYAEDLDHDGIVAALDPLFAAYAKERQKGERFGEFAIRVRLRRRDRQRRATSTPMCGAYKPKRHSRRRPMIEVVHDEKGSTIRSAIKKSPTGISRTAADRARRAASMPLREFLVGMPKVENEF